MNHNFDDLWLSVCGELEVSMSTASFSAWIKPCRILSVKELENGVFLVEITTPSAFHLRTINEKYLEVLIEMFRSKVKGEVELVLTVGEKLSENKDKNKVTARTNNELLDKVSLFTPDKPEQQVGSNLNSKYIFDSYVVGGPNRLAFAAAKSAAEYPGTRHNPLFIYGGVGVGKTHLMHAVGHELVKKGVGKVVYVTSEQFTNDLVSSFRSKMTEAFKKKYRQVGALLIDDVQFFAGKESTQEEFFHTFNELTMKGSQIIMTSDRKPQEIVGLEDRLISRFLGGLAVDIGLPDYEMKMAILKQKASEMEVAVDDDAFDLIVNSMNTNAREIEGTFVKLAVMAGISGGVLTKEMVQETMGLPAAVTKVTKVRPVKVISTVAKYFDYRNKDLLGSSRKADLVIARHIAMYLLRDALDIQLAKVGEIMGGRDHTTVMHAVGKIESEMKDNADMRRKIMAVKQALYT